MVPLGFVTVPKKMTSNLKKLEEAGKEMGTWGGYVPLNARKQLRAKMGLEISTNSWSLFIYWCISNVAIEV